MALKLRLARGGRKGRPFHKIVVADSRMPRDGRFIEKIGTYNPLLANDNPNRVMISEERVKYWLGQGAKPSDRVAKMLGKLGLIPMPKYNETPQKSAPKEKARLRLEEKEEKLKAKQEAEKTAAEEAKQEANAEQEAPAESTDAPAESSDAEASQEKGEAKQAAETQDEAPSADEGDKAAEQSDDKKEA